jgi:hypothetical protein
MLTLRLDLHWNVLTVEQIASVVAAAWGLAQKRVNVDARGISVHVDDQYRNAYRNLGISCPCLECLDRVDRVPKHLPAALRRTAPVGLDDRELLSDKLFARADRPREDETLRVLSVPRWSRLSANQVGAIAAYLFRLGGVREVCLTRSKLQVRLNPIWTETEEVDIEAVEDDLAVLARAEVELCPCGCGVPQVLGPCRRDFNEPDVLMRELNLYRTGERVQAIREIRQRTGCDLHEARLRLRVITL